MPKHYETSGNYNGTLYKIKVVDHDDGTAIVSAAPADRLGNGFTVGPLPYDGDLQKLTEKTVRMLVEVYTRGLDDGWYDGYHRGYEDGEDDE